MRIEDPVLALVRCGQHRIPGPLVAWRVDDERMHCHVLVDNTDEPTARDWVRANTGLAGFIRDDGTLFPDPDDLTS
jgi:uncharacterized protein YijF (DUF1287 family)